MRTSFSLSLQGSGLEPDLNLDSIAPDTSGHGTQMVDFYHALEHAGTLYKLFGFLQSRLGSGFRIDLLEELQMH